MTAARRFTLARRLAAEAVGTALLLAAVGASLCGLFGEQCTAEEQRTIALLSFASLGVFLFVPAAVAAVRRQARWLLAPVVEVVLVVLAVRLNEWF